MEKLIADFLQAVCQNGNDFVSAAKNDVGSCDDTINDVVADFNGDLEQRELMRNLALLKNIITGYEITLKEYCCVYPQVLLRLLLVVPATSAILVNCLSLCFIL